MTARDILLLIVLAAGGRIEGRTVMQKLAYFSALALGASFGHRAHYYGPYSARVEDALTLAVIAGDLQETVGRFPAWYGSSPDLQRYTYEFTDEGRRRALELAERHGDDWGTIENAVAAIRTVVPDLNQKTLSSAAKTYLIINEGGTDISVEEIPVLARQLGWELTEPEVAKTVELLDQLGLIELSGAGEGANLT